MHVIRPALKLFITLFVLTGVIYPSLITLVAQLTMPKKAEGSLVVEGENVRGSSLIAQPFKGENYFWPRPSAIDYDPMKPSGGSNLGPISKKLKETIDERAKLFKSDPASIPSELVYASGSGLDPHISLQGAYFQMERVAKARAIQDPNQLKSLIHSATTPLGRENVNVLLLNQALDKQFPPSRS